MISSDILTSKIYSCFQWTISLGTLYFSEPASDGSSAKYVALLLILNHEIDRLWPITVRTFTIAKTFTR